RPLDGAEDDRRRLLRQPLLDGVEARAGLLHPGRAPDPVDRIGREDRERALAEQPLVLAHTALPHTSRSIASRPVSPATVAPRGSQSRTSGSSASISPAAT